MINWSVLRKKDYGERYAKFLTRSPVWVMIVVLSLTALSLLVSIEWLATDHSTTAMFAPDSLEIQEYQRYLDEFGEPDDLVVVVEGGQAAERRQVIEALAHVLEQEPVELIDRIFFQVPIWSYATLLYASDEHLETIQSLLDDSTHPLNQMLVKTNLEQMFGYIADFLDQELKTGQADEDPTPFLDAAAELFPSFVDELQAPSPAARSLLIRWGRLFDQRLEQADEEGFLVADNGNLHLAFIKPGDVTGDTEQSIALVQMVRRHLNALKERHPDLIVGLTGEPALRHDEFEISKRDMLLATLFALVTTAVIFYLAFHSFARPFLGFCCLIMGVCLTFGLTTITIGHLNLISLSFAVILIGLGTQYGIHIIARYEEERGRRRSIQETVHILMTQTVRSLWIGALTTAAAFYATMAIDFRGFRELAFIAGSGVLICFFLMSFGLPAFLVWHDRRKPDRPLRDRPLAPLVRSRVGRFYVDYLTRYPRSFLVAALCLAIFSVWSYFNWGPSPFFDYNLLNLQAKGAEAVEFEKRLLETDASPRFAIYMAESKEEADRVAAEAESQPAIGRVETLFTLVPDPGQKKLDTVREVGHRMQEHFAFGNRPTDVASVVAALKKLETSFASLEEKLFAGGYVEALDFAETIGQSLAGARVYLQSLSIEEASKRLNHFQESITEELRNFFQRESERDANMVDDLPPAVKERFLSPNGVYAVYAFPQDSIWDRDGLRIFVHDVRAVSERFHGPPLQMFAVTEAMESGWYLTALYAAIAIFILFWLDFKSLRWALIATVPLACGLAWLYGGMALFNLKWNIVNLIALPLVIGIGADCGIHLIHRYRENQKRDVSFVLSSTGKAVTVAYSDTLTSFIGLAVASHQGLASLGRVIIWGIFCCYLAGMIVLPALLSAFSFRNGPVIVEDS